MFECCDIPSHLCHFPTELIIYIFKFLSAKNLITCRRVCRRWKEIIDDVSNDENMWEEHCKLDFETLYLDAKKKSKSYLQWFDIYRSLSLWCCLPDATEVRDEFCHSSVVADEIKDLCILKNGVISVHKRGSVSYYDISTFEASQRQPIYGEFSKFEEYDDAVIILGNHLHLRIVKKVKKENIDSNNDKQEETIYRNIRHFLMYDKHIYFIHFSNSIFYCNIDNGLKALELPRNYNETVLTLSLHNSSLYILTAECNVYIYENNTFVKLFNLESKKNNIFDCLWRYQFIENIDWLIFYIWVTNLRITIPEGPLRYISMIKVYGDVFFIGCKNGIVLIYYKPYTEGQLDLFNCEPIKQYRFAEREDIPVLSLHPILKIDIEEINAGHKLLIAMPKKVVIVMYKHNFEVVKSKAVVPYVSPGPTLMV